MTVPRRSVPSCLPAMFPRLLHVRFGEILRGARLDPNEGSARAPPRRRRAAARDDGRRRAGRMRRGARQGRDTGGGGRTRGAGPEGGGGARARRPLVRTGTPQG